MPENAQTEEDYQLLNSQQGTAGERLDAYKNLANQVEQNTTREEQEELGNYVEGSEPTNLLLRGQKGHLLYPQEKKFKDESLRTSKFVSSAIEKNRIQKDMNVFRGIPDSKLGEMLTQKGLTRAVKEDGRLDHKWIRNNMKDVQNALINTTFADNGFTSTTTEKGFARYWAQFKNQQERLRHLGLLEDMTSEDEREYKRLQKVDPEKNNVPSGHIIKMSLPAGSRAAPISSAAKKAGKGSSMQQREVLVDKGSLFKITGFDVNNDEDAGPDSFNLMMELLSDEEGMEPTGNAVENLIQPNGGGGGEDLLIDSNELDNLSGIGNDLLIGNDDLDNRAVIGKEDTAYLKRLRKKKRKH